MIDDTAAAIAGTDTATDTGADTGLDFDIGTGTDTTEAPETQAQETQQAETQQPQRVEEPDVKDFAGHVSNRIRNLVKIAPDLGKVLTANPKVRDAIEAPLRREAAYRDVFPTVAEAKAMRERFPNGLQDVAALEEDVKEIEGIDKLTYEAGPDGNYPGHGELIGNIFKSDSKAAVALFKTLPKEWYRLDPASYNDVMGRIVGATLTGSGAWEGLVELREALAATEGKVGVAALDKVLNRLAGFVEERRPDPAQEALARDRQQFEKQQQQSRTTDQQQFDRNVSAENLKLQREVVSGHKVMQKLAAVKSITSQKRAEIVEKVRGKMEQFLRNSPSFMRPLTAAYQSRNMAEMARIQRAAWGQDWLLNRMIRDVLRVETPQLVNTNRATVQKRAGAVTKPAAKSNAAERPTAPFKEGGVWYNANGTRMTTSEAIKYAMTQP
jgi:hypothetical protein